MPEELFPEEPLLPPVVVVELVDGTEPLLVEVVELVVLADVVLVEGSPVLVDVVLVEGSPVLVELVVLVDVVELLEVAGVQGVGVAG